MRVLLVSDDTDLSVALQIMLREEPCCDIVASVSSSSAAHSRSATDCPDLIVLDWDLRKNSAPGILATVQKLDSRPHVVAIGKYEADENAALEAGAKAFALKGASPMNLLNVIRQIGRHKP